MRDARCLPNRSRPLGLPEPFGLSGEVVAAAPRIALCGPVHGRYQGSLPAPPLLHHHVSSPPLADGAFTECRWWHRLGQTRGRHQHADVCRCAHQRTCHLVAAKSQGVEEPSRHQGAQGLAPLLARSPCSRRYLYPAPAARPRPHRPHLVVLLVAIHMGTWGGLFSRILTCLAALIGGILPLTGYYIWLRRIGKKRKEK